MGLTNGDKAGKLEFWTRMPVHPESAMRGVAGGLMIETKERDALGATLKEGAIEGKVLRGRGLVRGKLEASRR